MPNYLTLWHAVQDPTYSYSYVSWDGQGNVTLTQEAKDNAWAAWYRYNSEGWSDAAIAAVVGMQAYESGINPWRWQGNRTLASTDTVLRYDDYPYPSDPTRVNDCGYGMAQWTPQATYSDPEGYFTRKGSFPPNWNLWRDFFNSPMFQASFAPHYTDIMGDPKDGDAQCQLTNFVCSNSVGYYFRRGGSQNPRHYTYGYMPFSDFKSAILGQTYTSPDSATICDYQSYTITLSVLIYQWLNNFGRGAAETPTSEAVRLSAATQLYTMYTGTTPPVPPTPTTRKMPFWMLALPNIYLRSIYARTK